MKEIGGYLELETYRQPVLHGNAIALNCARNALAYLIEAKKIEKIYLPYFICDSVSNVCKKYNTKIRYYKISGDFLPIITETQKDEWLYVVNFYGQIPRDVLEELSMNYRRIIIDNTHDYFASPIQGVDTLYTCRKFLGVSDGAFLYSDIELDRELPQDESFERVRYLLGRFERTASEFYTESVENNNFFDNEPIKKMSKLTMNLLRSIDYEYVQNCRNNNFALLNSKLKDINKLNVMTYNSPYMYPFFTDDSEKIKNALLKNKIYIPTLWPNVLESVPTDFLEWNYAKNILPLPCDQRYSQDDMNRITEVIFNEL